MGKTRGSGLHRIKAAFLEREFRLKVFDSLVLRNYGGPGAVENTRTFLLI
ncbi:hypothetical protein DJ90_5876 [Paenibacillus macerans]|uniref:Uncharacterized protein n=1 Tax=Paenibacillus macerans TaxID=44252 RepID=A0A090YAZ5_PAEMA|nr:hypothetical protein DJ90_5876 [Paenibacillus macerans]